MIADTLSEMDDEEIRPEDHPDRFITKPGIVLLALGAQSYLLHLLFGLG